MSTFDLLGPLPEGTVVLEASAGTGKTFTIAGLVARYVAEGVAPLSSLLVVTFGRAATQELRDRVRARLVSARDGLADPVAAREHPDDALLRHLATGAADQVQERRDRLARALEGFDAATVVTTHGFCEQVLRSLGTAGDADAEATLVEDIDDLVTEVVEDFYVRKWGTHDASPVPPGFDLGAALALARTVVGDAGARLAPVGSGDAGAETRLRFATAVREEVQRRKREGRVLGFDDLLTRLRDTLADPDAGPAARERLRQRYTTVLVDEFQDTDPVQWQILREAFHGATTLVLIGDPKQAIYAFRGADVQAYLAAERVADHRQTLGRNWRSDPDLLTGLAALWRGAALGDPRIRVTPVEAAHTGRSLDAPGAPVRLRALPSTVGPTVAARREAVVADLVREVVALLDSGARLVPRPGEGGPRAVRPGDLAVVVRTNQHLDLVHRALLEADVPSVQRTTSSVFRTAAAREWIVLLEALEQPHRTGRVRRLALSPFLGWDAERLDRGDLQVLDDRLRAWLVVHRERGVAALFDQVTRDGGLLPRLLGQEDGERLLTDLRHVAEALHGATMTDQLGLTAALEWLRHRVDEAASDATVERSRRLDSDAAAVQVVTVHASKGLEFPVVYVPFLWDRWVLDVDVPLHHDGEARVRHVGGPGSPGFGDAVRRDHAEQYGEDLRLLYVAMTRARARVTAWWAPSGKSTTHAPLHRLLFGGDPALGPPEEVPVPPDSQAWPHLQSLAVDGCLAVERVPEAPAGGPVRWRPATGGAAALARARFDRALDLAWRRTSYSALTAAVHDARPAVASEPEVADKDDEPTTLAPTVALSNTLRDVGSPMADLPGGAGFGTMVHAVLESLDTAAPDLDAALREGAALAVARHGPSGLDPGAVAAALQPALRTPLGPLTADRPLAAVAPGDRLSELEFELPLAGGDRPHRSARLRDLAPVLREHLPADDALARYADLLDDPVLGESALRGYLTGSIDSVLRVDDRYVVVDYKTNRLGTPGAPLTAWDYRRAAMADAMVQAHYPLQALLYEVALHRYLRWRLPGYDADRHLGGVLYLFLRGMCGPDVRDDDGSVPGVFDWSPPAALVVAASDVLAGAR